MSVQDSVSQPEAVQQGGQSSPGDRQILRLANSGDVYHGGSLTGFSGYGRRWHDFVYLAYSVFFWIEPVMHRGLRSWTYFVAAYATFVTMYCLLMLAPDVRLRRVGLIGIAVLGLIYTPFNDGFIGAYIYVAAFLPFSVQRIRNIVLLLLATCAGMVGLGYFLHMNAWTWSTLTFVALASGGANIVHAQQKRAARALGMAHEEIERLAKLAERERIARDLHDVLGHTLSVIVLKAELAGKIFSQDAGRARQEIGEVEQIARTALGDVRQAIRGYRSAGLAAEIERARATLDAAGVSLESVPSIPSLRPGEESVVSLLVREAVTNIIRHASASSARIVFQQEKENTILTIEDNGRGGIRQEGNGLRGMRERVAALRGKINIDSNRGTRLLIEIPRIEQEQAS
ncbi:MAG: sensor histidine kinase [Terracidiphilus sp.]